MAKSQNGKVLTFRKNIGPAVECYWSDADATALRLAVDAVSRAGGAIMFGLTQDGGAYSIMVLLGQDKAKLYPHGPTELAETLAAIVAETT